MHKSSSCQGIGLSVSTSCIVFGLIMACLRWLLLLTLLSLSLLLLMLQQESLWVLTNILSCPEAVLESIVASVPRVVEAVAHNVTSDFIDWQREALFAMQNLMR